MLESGDLSLFVHIINKAFFSVAVDKQNNSIMQVLKIRAGHRGENTEFRFPLRLALDLLVLSKNGVGGCQKVHEREQRTMPGSERLHEMM